jgi:hypothetical protein
MSLRLTFTLVAGAVVAGLALAGSSVAKDTQVGSVAVTLPSPEGYCELSEQKPADARLIHLLDDLAIETKNELLTVAADCGQLEAWRAGKLPTLDDYAQYQTPIAVSGADAHSAGSVKEFCAAAHAEGKTLGAVTADINARVETATKGTKFNELGFLGVLAEDADVCYLGLLTKARTEDGSAEETQVLISAATDVKGKRIFYNFYTLYHGADSVTAALARHQRNVAALRKANGG